MPSPVSLTATRYLEKEERGAEQGLDGSLFHRLALHEFLFDPRNRCTLTRGVFLAHHTKHVSSDSCLLSVWALQRLDFPSYKFVRPLRFQDWWRPRDCEIDSLTRRGLPCDPAWVKGFRRDRVLTQLERFA